MATELKKYSHFIPVGKKHRFVLFSYHVKSSKEGGSEYHFVLERKGKIIIYAIRRGRWGINTKTSSHQTNLKWNIFNNPSFLRRNILYLIAWRHFTSNIPRLSSGNCWFKLLWSIDMFKTQLRISSTSFAARHTRFGRGT